MASSKPPDSKVFNDSIHGHIEIHPLCVAIIDTPQFQRLRHIKQLGCCYHVYPGASHNRFEHSLGVCYLAGELCRGLKQRQPELGIKEEDILCVEVAGLCHDLGHGPFSHVFDNEFIPRVKPDSKWKHEQASVKMLQHIIESNQLENVFAKYKLEKKDITFIKEQIIAGPLEENKKQWRYEGRKQNKSFLYDIIANKRNGIDVDKWDYFIRDSHHLGLRCSFDYRRFLQFCRVIKVDKEMQICTRDKEVENLYELFETRYTLHRKAYQHRVTKIIETIVVDALVEAKDIKIEGKDGKPVKICDAIDDMVAYSKLTDDIIFHTKMPKRAMDILVRIQKRQLYKFIGEAQSPTGKEYNKAGISLMIQEILEMQVPPKQQLKNKLVLHIIDINYGKGGENPIDSVRFYHKGNPDTAVMIPKNEVSSMLRDQFKKQSVRLFCKSDEGVLIEKAKDCFDRWCKKNNMTMMKQGKHQPPQEKTPATAKKQAQKRKRPDEGESSDSGANTAGKKVAGSDKMAGGISEVPDGNKDEGGDASTGGWKMSW